MPAGPPELPRPVPQPAPFVLLLSYAMLCTVLIGLSGPMILVWQGVEVPPPPPCALAMDVGHWLSHGFGLLVAGGVALALWYTSTRLVPAPHRGRVCWTASAALLAVTGFALLVLWVPTSKLARAIALHENAAPR